MQGEETVFNPLLGGVNPHVLWHRHTHDTVSKEGAEPFVTEGVYWSRRLRWDGLTHQAAQISIISRTSHLKRPDTSLAVACMFYLDAELVVCRGVVKFPPGDDGINVAVLEIWEDLQMSGFLWQNGKKRVKSTFKKKNKTAKIWFIIITWKM